MSVKTSHYWGTQIEEYSSHDDLTLKQSEPVKQEHMKVTTILHALKNILKASAAYDTIPARFVDSVLNGLYSYWPVFPFGVSSVRGNITLDSSWHVRLSNTVLHFMRSSLYPDFYGQPNSNQGPLILSLTDLLQSSLSHHSFFFLKMMLSVAEFLESIGVEFRWAPKRHFVVWRYRKTPSSSSLDPGTTNASLFRSFTLQHQRFCQVFLYLD